MFNGEIDIEEMEMQNNQPTGSNNRARHYADNSTRHHNISRSLSVTQRKPQYKHSLTIVERRVHRAVICEL